MRPLRSQTVEAGRLVPPEDPESREDSSTSLLSDPEKADALGAKAKDRIARELNWPHFTQRLLEALGERT